MGPDIQSGGVRGCAFESAERVPVGYYCIFAKFSVFSRDFAKMSAQMSKLRSNKGDIGVKSFLSLVDYKTGVLQYTGYFSKIQQLLSSAIPARRC